MRGALWFPQLPKTVWEPDVLHGRELSESHQKGINEVIFLLTLDALTNKLI